MREMATDETRFFWWKDGDLCEEAEWLALVYHTEELAATKRDLRDIAYNMFPVPWFHLGRLPRPYFHRLYPQELLDLLEAAGIEPPQLDAAKSR